MGRPGSFLPPLRRLLPILSIAVAIGVLYDGWIFYARWRDARRAEQYRQEKQASDARKSVTLAGGGRFQILDFYATPVVIKQGEHATICFGVSGAKRVRIEPPVEALHPALNYCLQVAPRKDTEYTLTAESTAGEVVTRSLRIKVQ